MTTARQKILAYLDKSRTASAREISRSLKMSAATVRHHLRVLVSDGRLEPAATRVRGREGRGRPEKVYSLPSAALGDNLSALSEALLTEAGAGVPIEALVGRVARRLLGESDFASQPLAKRLNLTIERLNQMNYHARWEAGSEGPRLIFGHCPYAAIIEKHPELCRMDEAMLNQWMGQPATQVFKAGKEGSSVCMFAIGR
ncbi:MAG TPA: winged helix-turn-helix transcriptional regulator [Anaerolineales bacterium]|nr:winged helix-turn-helix transcriptional regulator [Anaerolineales bacterium]